MRAPALLVLLLEYGKRGLNTRVMADWTDTWQLVIRGSCRLAGGVLGEPWLSAPRSAGDGIQQKLSSLQQYTTGLNATTRAACCLQGRSANSSAFFNVVFGSSKNTA